MRPVQGMRVGGPPPSQGGDYPKNTLPAPSNGGVWRVKTPHALPRNEQYPLRANLRQWSSIPLSLDNYKAIHTVSWLLKWAICTGIDTTPYRWIGNQDQDQEHSGREQAAPIAYEQCRPNRAAPTVHTRQGLVLHHHKAPGALYHDLQSDIEGVYYRPWRIPNLTHNHKLRQFV